MTCRPFEGTLYKKKLLGRQKCRAFLHRGTITLFDKHSDVDDKKKPLAKKLVYRHLDSADVFEGKKLDSFKIRLNMGELLKFRVPKESGAAFRGEWIAAVNFHIAFANRCVGQRAVTTSDGMNLTELSSESEKRVKALQDALVSFNLAIRGIQPRVLNSGITENLQNVAGASEKALSSLQEFCEALMQENLVTEMNREEEVTLERDRAQLIEDTLEVVSQRYNVLIGGTDPGSRISSEYFTPEGSLRGFEDAYHDDESVTDPRDFSKITSERLRLSENVEQVLRSLEASGHRRNLPRGVPRPASFGPMSIAGSSYGDALSNGFAKSDSDQFQDCISLDTRSFVISNANIVSDEPVHSRSIPDSQSYKTAMSGAGG